MALKDAEQTVEEWLLEHGVSPNWRPQTHSLSYTLWGCFQSHDQKVEMLRYQGWRCGECGKLISMRTSHLHHRSYDHLGDEQASDLEVLHPKCHRRVHERMTCGCQLRAA